MSAEPMAEVDATADGAAAPPRHRPQSLLLSFFGALVVDFGLPPLPSMTLLDLLGRPRRDRGGRPGHAQADDPARTARPRAGGPDGGVRPHSPGRGRAPRRPASGWSRPRRSTTPPASGRCSATPCPRAGATCGTGCARGSAGPGFGGLRDGLWIAPGTVDVAAVLGRSDLADVAGLADAFAARPLPGHRPRPAGAPRLGRAGRPAGAHLVHRDVEPPPRVGGSLAQLTLLGADWLALLRTDPGLPAAQLGPDWPAATSSATYRRVFDGLEPAARAALERGLRATGRSLPSRSRSRSG